MIAGDAIGFHAIAEQITSTLPPVVYLTNSRPTGTAVSNYFKEREDYSAPVTEGILWDDNSNILWDDDTNIEFG